MVELVGVSKAFSGRNGAGDLQVVRDLTLTVERGEFVSIVGPSGCGKSTVLMMIAGLVTADSGLVTVGGCPPAQARRDGRFGIVFQDPVLLGWRTVQENVELPGEILGSAEVKSRAGEALSLMELVGFEGVYPHELSGGMRSRAAIARALTLHPEMLLMDEPFADLDELTRWRLNLELLRIRSQTGATVVFITHSVQEAAFLSDRVLVLSGRPASVVADVRVDVSGPRNLSTIDTVAYLETVGLLRRYLNSPLADGVVGLEEP